jgi:hypothetical protein
MDVNNLINMDIDNFEEFGWDLNSDYFRYLYHEFKNYILELIKYQEPPSKASLEYLNEFTRDNFNYMKQKKFFTEGDAVIRNHDRKDYLKKYLIAANLLKDSDLEKIFEYIDKMPGGKIKFPVILALSLIFKSIKDINEERRSEEIDCYSEPKIMEYLSNYLKNG